MDVKAKVIELSQSGMKPTQIAEKMIELGTKTPTGLKWKYQNVISILRGRSAAKARTVTGSATTLKSAAPGTTYLHNLQAKACIDTALLIMKNNNVPDERRQAAIDALLGGLT